MIHLFVLEEHLVLLQMSVQSVLDRGVVQTVNYQFAMDFCQIIQVLCVVVVVHVSLLMFVLDVQLVGLVHDVNWPSVLVCLQTTPQCVLEEEAVHLLILVRHVLLDGMVQIVTFHFVMDFRRDLLPFVVAEVSVWHLMFVQTAFQLLHGVDLDVNCQSVVEYFQMTQLESALVVVCVLHRMYVRVVVLHNLGREANAKCQNVLELQRIKH